MANSTNQVVSLGTTTSLISVYFILSTDRVEGAVGVADAVFHVIAEDTNTFAEDIVVDLVLGAVYCCTICFVIDGN